MILTCTNCKTSFVAPDTLIGPSGRKVKCSKCQFIWFATLPQKPKAEVLTPLPDVKTLQGSFNLPIVAAERIGWYLYFMPLLFILSIASALCLLFPHKVLALKFVDQKMLCENLQVCDTKGIKLKDVEFNTKDKEGKNIAVLSYKIANNTNNQKNIPIIRVKLLDKDLKVVKSHTATNQTSFLKPYHQHLVETRFEDLPESVAKIELSIGNRLELVLR
jgi:predicted Zn finger-like uncharacterized protein